MLRLVPAACLAALAVSACGSAREAQPVYHGEQAVLRTVIHKAFETDDPSVCDRYATQRWREQLTSRKGPQATYDCHDDVIDGGEADSVDIETLHIKGRRAGARIAVNGGENDGMTFTMLFVKRSGWRMDRIAHVKFDRKRVDRAVTDQLVKELEGASRGDKQCVFDGVQGLSDAAFEHALVDSRPAAIARPFLGCALRSGLRDTDAPEAVVDCLVANFLRQVTDEQVLAVAQSGDEEGRWIEPLMKQAALECGGTPPPTA